MSKSVCIGSSRSIVQPSDTLQTDTNINNSNVKLLSSTIMESLVLHKHHVSDLEASDEVFDGRSQVSTTGPNVLDIGNLFWRDLKCLSQPTVVEFQALIFKEFVVIWVVEDLLSHHDKSRIVTACKTNIVKIIETSTELRTNKWVGWWVQLTSDTVWLEAENARCHKINVIAPSSDDWVSLDRVAWNSSGGKTFFITLPSLSKSHLLSFTKTISNKGVLSSASNEKVLELLCFLLTQNHRKCLASRYSASRNFCTCRTEHDCNPSWQRLQLDRTFLG